jgi:lipopolysaccharide/colanic/teichoic acid biosynthesis glycosyltransferase
MATRIHFARLRRLLQQSDPPDGVLSEHAFRKALDRECSRADRAGHHFSLLLYDFRDATGSIRPSPSLVQHIVHRVRTSDQIGMFESKRIGIILPETDSAGARVLAETLRFPLSLGNSQVTYRIFVYPSLWKDPRLPAENPRKSPQRSDSGTGDTTFNEYSDTAILPLGHLVPPFSYSFSWKRALDALASALLLILFSPLMLLVSLLIFVVSPGPVIYRQRRLGFMSKPFTMWKFRTMHLNCDETIHQNHITVLLSTGQPLKKLDAQKDPRLIRLGRLLRRYYIDELPQLVNVLRGDMSLVGPRPCLQFEAENLLGWQKRRFYSMPGMTGLWQVNGKESATHLQMLRYDVAYTHNSSVYLNLRIMFHTLLMITGSLATKALFGTISSKDTTLFAPSAIQEGRRN